MQFIITQSQCGFVVLWVKKIILKNAKYWKVGDIDPSNGWKVRSSCYNVPYKNLLSFEDLLNIPQKMKERSLNNKRRKEDILKLRSEGKSYRQN